jgi:tRNA nucleotidyltransferase (CCA-adding enzyme)
MFDVYLVGGAVRDRRLNLPVTERDYVVVGSNPQAMLDLGYRQVGRDFPVFLHPDTDDEYALARTERKVGPGHTGFEVHAGEEVTLEEDLRRRDLTINAMAEAADGTLIDPWGGAADLAAGCLRHVSEAFSEDPLRVFRVARFAARFAREGFSIAPETLTVMQTMVAASTLEELAPERVFGELEKALGTDAPGVFFEVLNRCGALKYWFPDLESEPLKAWLDLLTRVAAALPETADRYATMGWLVDVRREPLRLPKEFQRLVEGVSRPGRELPGWREAAPDSVLGWIRALDGLRQPARFARVLNVVECCSGIDLDALAKLVDVVNSIDAAPLRAGGLDGAELGVALDAERCARIVVAQQTEKP